MNYHFMIDEKFTDDFIADAERYAPGNNIYLVTLYTPQPRFTKSPLIIYQKSVKKYWFSQIAPRLKSTDQVFIHWLDRRVYDIILSLPAVIHVGIFSWMGDLIATPSCLFEKEILKPVSYAFFRKHKRYQFQKDRSHGVIYNMLLFGRHIFRILNAPREWSKKKKVMQRIDLFFHWNEFDYQWVKKRYPGFKALFVYFVYDVGLDNSFSLPTGVKNAQDPLTIWLGNSATVSNNHFEALDELGHLKDDPIEIICPLSYGELPDSVYTQQLIRKGKQIFGNKFIPLLTYLERDQYYALFQKVDVVLMNHVRSQAAGNVFAFLKLDKIIFMEEKSTLYQFLFAKNIDQLYAMGDMKKYSFSALKALTLAERSHTDINTILDLNLKVENLKKYLQ